MSSTRKRAISPFVIMFLTLVQLLYLYLKGVSNFVQVCFQSCLLQICCMWKGLKSPVSGKLRLNSLHKCLALSHIQTHFDGFAADKFCDKTRNCDKISTLFNNSIFIFIFKRFSKNIAYKILCLHMVFQGVKPLSTFFVISRHFNYQ